MIHSLGHDAGVLLLGGNITYPYMIKNSEGKVTPSIGIDEENIRKKAKQKILRGSQEMFMSLTQMEKI